MAVHGRQKQPAQSESNIQLGQLWYNRSREMVAAERQRSKRMQRAKLHRNGTVKGVVEDGLKKGITVLETQTIGKTNLTAYAQRRLTKSSKVDMRPKSVGIVPVRRFCENLICLIADNMPSSVFRG